MSVCFFRFVRGCLFLDRKGNMIQYDLPICLSKIGLESHQTVLLVRSRVVSGSPKRW